MTAGGDARKVFWKVEMILRADVFSFVEMKTPFKRCSTNRRESWALR
jgi:hypothetical protein